MNDNDIIYRSRLNHIFRVDNEIMLEKLNLEVKQ